MVKCDINKYQSCISLQLHSCTPMRLRRSCRLVWSSILEKKNHDCVSSGAIGTKVVERDYLLSCCLLLPYGLSWSLIIFRWLKSKICSFPYYSSWSLFTHYFPHCRNQCSFGSVLPFSSARTKSSSEKGIIWVCSLSKIQGVVAWPSSVFWKIGQYFPLPKVSEHAVTRSFKLLLLCCFYYDFFLTAAARLFYWFLLFYCFNFCKPLQNACIKESGIQLCIYTKKLYKCSHLAPSGHVSLP